MKPLAVDLFCGLGGWTDGLLAEGWDVVGYDIEKHEYGNHKYPAKLVLRNVLTIHGSEVKNAQLIVASPPCTEYSYMAMPWSRAKQIARGLRGEGDFPEGYRGSRTKAELTALFDACFRIQREASAAAGRHIPLVVENVRGAQPWVGKARANYGSFYLWGDVPALMPRPFKARKVPGFRFDGRGGSFQTASVEKATKNEGGSWFNVAHNTTSGKGRNPDGRKTVGLINIRDGHSHTRHLMNQAEHDAVKVSGDWFSDPTSPGRQGGMTSGTKQPGLSGIRENGKGDAWFQDGAARHGSKSSARKAASARIAMIPERLARWIARYYHPEAPK